MPANRCCLQTQSRTRAPRLFFPYSTPLYSIVSPLTTSCIACLPSPPLPRLPGPSCAFAGMRVAEHTPVFELPAAARGVTASTLRGRIQGAPLLRVRFHRRPEEVVQHSLPTGDCVLRLGCCPSTFVRLYSCCVSLLQSFGLLHCRKPLTHCGGHSAAHACCCLVPVWLGG